MEKLALISEDDFFLLLEGWRESRLRVKFLSAALKFSAFCEVLDARDGHVAFWIEEENKSAADFNVTGCFFGFRDVTTSETGLPEGVEVESAIEAVRDDFALLIMLLKCD
jgi:hypothetical protein